MLNGEKDIYYRKLNVKNSRYSQNSIDSMSWHKSVALEKKDNRGTKKIC